MNPLIYNKYCNRIFGRNDARSIEFFWGWFNLNNEPIHPELLNLMAAKYIWISRKYLEKESAAKNLLAVSESWVPIYEDDSDIFFFNPEALPRAYVVGEWHVALSDEEALEIISSEEFAADKEAILCDLRHQRSDETKRRASGESQAVITSLEPEEVSINVSMDGEGFLVLTDQYYPGWEVWVDGNRSRILRANYLFRCVALASGEHEVIFRYRPESYLAGAILACFGLLILLCNAVIAAVRSSTREEKRKEQIAG
jgi:hypothetical protein